VLYIATGLYWVRARRPAAVGSQSPTDRPWKSIPCLVGNRFLGPSRPDELGGRDAPGRDESTATTARPYDGLLPALRLNLGDGI